MNVRQKFALWVGIAVIGLLCFFPPQVVVPAPVSLIASVQFQFAAPAAHGEAVMPALPYTRYSFLFAPPPGSAGIDWPRLLLPLGFVVAATLGAVLTLHTKLPAEPAV